LRDIQELSIDEETSSGNAEQSAAIPSSDIQRAPIEEVTSSGDAEQSAATPSSDIQRAPTDEEDSQLEPGNTIKLISTGEESEVVPEI